MTIFGSMIKWHIVFIFFLTITSVSFAQQIKRFNPDTIRTIVIDSAVNIHSHHLNAQDFIDAVHTPPRHAELVSAPHLKGKR